MAAHRHNWQLVNSKPTRDGSGKTIYFYECINPGCPNPHRSEVK